jgi:hypothetical protein
MNQPTWFKSSYSSGNGACIECAHIRDGMAVRDSKHPAYPALAFPRAAWRDFLAEVREACQP